jgi:hypothetical protein
MPARKAPAFLADAIRGSVTALFPRPRVMQAAAQQEVHRRSRMLVQCVLEHVAIDQVLEHAAHVGAVVPAALAQAVHVRREEVDVALHDARQHLLLLG